MQEKCVESKWNSKQVYDKTQRGKQVNCLGGHLSSVLPAIVCSNCSRCLSYQNCNCTGLQSPVVGRVSMDAVTAIVDQGTSLTTPFVVYADDFSSPNSVTNICRVLDTIPQEVCALLPTRLPRVYVTKGAMFIANN